LGRWPTSRPGCFRPEQRTSTNCTGGWVVSGQVWETYPLSGFDPRNVQPPNLHTHMHTPIHTYAYINIQLCSNSSTLDPDRQQHTLTPLVISPSSILPPIWSHCALSKAVIFCAPIELSFNVLYVLKIQSMYGTSLYRGECPYYIGGVSIL
jgi:hypothetical protein